MKVSSSSTSFSSLWSLLPSEITDHIKSLYYKDYVLRSFDRRCSRFDTINLIVQHSFHEVECLDMYTITEEDVEYMKHFIIKCLSGGLIIQITNSFPSRHILKDWLRSIDQISERYNISIHQNSYWTQYLLWDGTFYNSSNYKKGKFIKLDFYVKYDNII